MHSAKPRVGEIHDAFTLQSVAGDTVTIAGPKDRWTMLVVYRGKHCPRCKRYLSKLNEMLPQWSALLDLVVVSADDLAKASADRDAFGWDFNLCYGLDETQMRALGLYISVPLSEAETTQNFAEPGTFVFRPDGSLMLVDISNGPASRPDLDELLDGIAFNIKNDRPVRGTV